jgi:hypothetical protein
MQQLPNPPSGVVVRHRVPDFSERWVLYEGHVPEAAWHDAAADRIRRVLEAFVTRSNRPAFVYRNLAIRVREDRPSLGFDPDVCWVEPAPADPGRVDSLRLWRDTTPKLSIEFVSKSHPTKDYVEVPDQCAAAGIFELVIFDPLRSGPRAHGGPFLLQVWRRADDGGFERVAAGDGPVASEVFDGFWIPREAERLLLLADDPAGNSIWPTPEEVERIRADAERIRADAAQSELEALRRRIAELEKQP